jgi:hypothetical protein
MILFLAVVLGWVIGILRGGRTSRLANPGFRAVYLPIIAAVIQYTAPPLVSLSGLSLEKGYWLVVCLSYGADLIFAIVNYRLWWGALGIALGTISNFTVIAVNGWRMPVSPVAANLSQITAPAERLGYFMATPAAKLLFLGDIIPLPIPLIAGYLSVGDILLSVGVILLVYHRMRPTSEDPSKRKEKIAAPLDHD